MPFTLRLGPFWFDSRRGTLALRTRRMTLESRTRSERRARKERRARRRVERRAAQIEAMNAARRAWRGDPEPTPTRPAASRTTQPRLEPTGRPSGPRLEEPARGRPARPSAGERPGVGQGTTGPLVISPTGQVRPNPEAASGGRAARTPAGLCGERTADGTPCRRRGKCPPGTHTTALR